MNDGSFLDARTRLETALSRLEQQFALLDARLQAHLAAPPPADANLLARHDALKADVASVIAELDEMLGSPAEMNLHHG
ncbi:hypothetical protein GV829_10930 [Sphingomonas lacunae]|uniref:Uncharacterized protein n=1 Tax=Sphingomonas lacunae TaxID=2698828 RepID=A0A6M4AX21_9SPHN|nr:hypothetical protein [Sphingomonas lacunae]QJQ32892.1 hypothetical protein GV829_10930 [Sphingomonas lacunae]